MAVKAVLKAPTAGFAAAGGGWAVVDPSVTAKSPPRRPGWTVVVVDGLMVVASVAVAGADPPPATVTELVTEDGAVADAVTLTVMGGYVAPAAKESSVLHVLLGAGAPASGVQSQR